MSDEDETYEDRWTRLMGYLEGVCRAAEHMHKNADLPAWIYENIFNRVEEIERDLYLDMDAREQEKEVCG